MALKNNHDAAVLLNGAFSKHHTQRSYRKSRGLLFLDIFQTSNPVEGFRTIDLYGIEPFTLVLFLNGNLYECRWDGNRKYSLQLDAAKACIWSSATLYDNEAQRAKQDSFYGHLKKFPVPDRDAILEFHRHESMDDSQNDALRTLSISTIALTPQKATFTYFDLVQNTTAIAGFEPQKAHAKTGSLYV